MKTNESVAAGIVDPGIVVVAGIVDPGRRRTWPRARPAGITDPGYNLLLAISVLFLAFSNAVSAADDAETKLREQLRSTMLQLRTIQNEKAALQAQQTDSEQKLKTLTAQVESLTKQASEAEKTSADQAAEIVQYKEALEKWKVAYQQANEVATGKEAERARLADKSITLERRAADLQMKNAALFKLGNDILKRYERFGLGDALAAKEPFTGITRVKLENLVQDYQDKLIEQRAKR